MTIIACSMAGIVTHRWRGVDINIILNKTVLKGSAGKRQGEAGRGGIRYRGTGNKEDKQSCRAGDKNG